MNWLLLIIVLTAAVANASAAMFDRFGGWADGPALKATGSFRTEKVDGKWWFVDPDGHLFFSLGVQAVNRRPEQEGNAEYYALVTNRHGSADAAGAAAIARMKEWGLNTIGPWSGCRPAGKKIPYCGHLWVGKKKIEASKGWWGKFPDPYAPGFRQEVVNQAKAQLNGWGAPSGRDSYCIGYFVNNEMSWSGDDMELARSVIRSPETQPARLAFAEVLRCKYGAEKKLSEGLPEDDLKMLEEMLAEKFFSTVAEALHEVLPNKLFLGSRIAWGGETPLRACAKYADVVSVNTYKYSPEVRLPPDAVDKPMLVSEFLRECLASPQYIGAHWFQWLDSPPMPDKPDAWQAQSGLVRMDDTPYAETVAAIRAVADEMYCRRVDANAPETVWLDEPGVWERMSGGHGRSRVCTNGNDMVGERYKRGVGTCAPSALYLAVNGNALSFEATAGQLGKPNKSKLTFRVWRENELAFETPVLSSNSGPHKVMAELAGARWVKLEVHGIESPYSGNSIWADAKFEMKAGTRPQDIIKLSRQLGVLTPPVAKAPRINGPRVYGVRPGHPIFYRLPVTGARPMKVATIATLPPGLCFDPETRILSGSIEKPGEYGITFTAENSEGRDCRYFTIKVGEKIALTPPLGWNSWNAFASKVTAQIVKETADEMEKLGLGEHGWTYLTIDDGWQIKASSKAPHRDARGRPLSNELFPDMKELADYVHSRGFKIGLYSSPGPVTCAGYEGSWMHESVDARTYAEWGYDYLKHDWCSYGSVAFGEGVEKWMYPYIVMGRALRESGRDIVFSICEYGEENVAAWGAAAGGQCWRTTGDKFDFWEDVVTDMKTHENLWRYAGPGAWNDADMMLIGKTVWSDHKGTRLTPNEQYTHVSMWAMWAAPMMIGCDLRGIDPFTLSLITNYEVIDLNQDELGAAAAKIQGGDDWAVWARPLSDGSIAVALVNLSPFEQKMLFCLKKAGMEGTWKVRDLWRQKDEGDVKTGYRVAVPGHATHLVKFTPSDGAGLRKGLADVRENDWFRRIETFRQIPGGASAAPCAKCDD